MHSLYYKGNITWEDPKVNDIRNKFPIDLNDISAIVNLIPNSQSQKDYNAYDSAWNNDIGFSNIFGNSSSALSGYEIEDIKKLGLGDYAPKILTIEVKPTKNILISNKKNIIKNDTKHDIIIAYNIEDMLDDHPEIIIKNYSLVKVINKEYVNYE